MLCKHPLLALTSGLVLSLGSVGCVGNKNKDVAETPLAAPPAAAYPDSPGYPDSSGNPSPAVAANDYTATNASSPAANSVTFQLRAGEQLITHSIKRGDTLSGIATQYNSSQSRIMAANGMTSTKIIAGETLRVPTSAPPTDVAMNGAGAGAPPASAGANPYPSPAPSSPYSRAGSLYSSPGLKAPSAPYFPPPAAAATAPPSSPYSPPAPVNPSPSYGSGSYGSPPTGGSYPSPTSASAPPAVQSGYSTNAPSAPVVPAGTSATSFPRVQNAPAPPQSGGTFPTPNLSSGSGQVQFSN